MGDSLTMIVWKFSFF